LPDEKIVEMVVLFSKRDIDSKRVKVEFSLEDMDMSEFQNSATYEQCTLKNMVKSFKPAYFSGEEKMWTGSG